MSVFFACRGGMVTVHGSVGTGIFPSPFPTPSRSLSRPRPHGPVDASILFARRASPFTETFGIERCPAGRRTRQEPNPRVSKVFWEQGEPKLRMSAAAFSCCALHISSWWPTEMLYGLLYSSRRILCTLTSVRFPQYSSRPVST